jgi:hypothetical protein
MNINRHAIIRKFPITKLQKKKQNTAPTSIDVFTDVYDPRSFTNPTPCYVKNSIKNIRVSIMHSDPAKDNVYKKIL